MNKNYSQTSFAKIALLSILILLSNSMFSQAKRNTTYDDYINTHKSTAIDHMNRYKIPASITLAQGLLESGAGRSELVQNSNNHFGIKCHTDWKGEKVYKADDTLNDCFRKYKKAEESFEDHSRFLAEKQRYKPLFALELTDYRGWAKGLQQLGYATDKAYANKLIKIVEDYELYSFDNRKYKSTSDSKPKDKQDVITQIYTHTPYKTHGLIYVLAQDGDTYEAIAQEFGFESNDLYSYNEVPDGFPLKSGDLVYFEKKKPKANKPYYDHVVQVGESMHSISQLYGMKVKNLYKVNNRDFEYTPEEGDVLKLR